MVLHSAIVPSQAVGFMNKLVLDGLLNGTAQLPPLLDPHGEEASTSTSSSTPSPSNDTSDVLNRVLQALHTSNPNFDLSLFYSNENQPKAPSVEVKKSPKNASEGGKEKAYKPRNSRMKVYADGYFMTFDKESSCGTKSFWRCERKNECPARMHTEINSNNIVKRIHPHNHQGPDDDELAFYNLNPADVLPNQVVPVVSVARFFKCRRQSRAQLAENNAKLEQSNVEEVLMQIAKAEVKQEEEVEQKCSPPPAATVSNNKIPSSVAINATTMINPNTGEIVPIVSKVSPKNQMKGPDAKKRKTSDKHEIEEDPNYPEVFEIAKQILNLMNKRTIFSSLHQDPLTIYVSHLNSTSSFNPDENPFHVIQIPYRTELALRQSLTNFCNQKCSGNILIAMSAKINVVVHDTMVQTWSNGKFFHLQTTKPQTWKLIPVNENDSL